MVTEYLLFNVPLETVEEDHGGDNADDSDNDDDDNGNDDYDF